MSNRQKYLRSIARISFINSVPIAALILGISNWANSVQIIPSWSAIVPPAILYFTLVLVGFKARSKLAGEVSVKLPDDSEFKDNATFEMNAEEDSIRLFCRASPPDFSGESMIRFEEPAGFSARLNQSPEGVNIAAENEFNVDSGIGEFRFIAVINRDTQQGAIYDLIITDPRNGTQLGAHKIDIKATGLDEES